MAIFVPECEQKTLPTRLSRFGFKDTVGATLLINKKAWLRGWHPGYWQNHQFHQFSGS
jgi:hypothetical protein